jgi:nitroreductase
VSQPQKIDLSSMGWLFDRRSVAALIEPAPTGDQIDVLIRAAATVPDHGNLRPWRLVLVAGDERMGVGNALARSATDQRPDLDEDGRDRLRQKAFAAPAQVLIIASPDPSSKVAEWEQLASAACTGFAIVLAAHALGIGAIWKSVPFTRGSGLQDLLHLTPDEQLLGWVNLGTPSMQPSPRLPADPGDYTSVLAHGSMRTYDRLPDR